MTISGKAAKGAALAVLLLVGAETAWNAIRYDLQPVFVSPGILAERLALSESEMTRLVSGQVGEAIDYINTLPPDTALYYVPNFPDTPGNPENQVSWWLMGHILRYFAYPRRVYSVHFDLYGNTRRGYIEKIMGGRTKFTEAEFIKSRGISYLITYRYDRVRIEPLTPEAGP